ncbi:hypothetical protein [Ottowia sp.]|nr:hypothetical protein [Ottowia sp.]MBK6745033.1 hypothetical protein [Ottowia sp.]
MKKSILSLSAAIALGGLGLASTAHAVVALGVRAPTLAARRPPGVW